MQDFAPFYPELLGAQTPGRIDTSLCEVWKSLRDFYSYLLQFKVGISVLCTIQWKWWLWD